MAAERLLELCPYDSLALDEWSRDTSIRVRWRVAGLLCLSLIAGSQSSAASAPEPGGAPQLAVPENGDASNQAVEVIVDGWTGFVECTDPDVVQSTIQEARSGYSSRIRHYQRVLGVTWISDAECVAGQLEWPSEHDARRSARQPLFAFQLTWPPPDCTRLVGSTHTIEWSGMVNGVIHVGRNGAHSTSSPPPLLRQLLYFSTMPEVACQLFGMSEAQSRIDDQRGGVRVFESRDGANKLRRRLTLVASDSAGHWTYEVFDRVHDEVMCRDFAYVVPQAPQISIPVDPAELRSFYSAVPRSATVAFMDLEGFDSLVGDPRTVYPDVAEATVEPVGARVSPVAITIASASAGMGVWLIASGMRLRRRNCNHAATRE